MSVHVPENVQNQGLNVLAYIGGYIVRKLQKINCKKQRFCANCLKMVEGSPDSKNSSLQFIDLKQHANCVTGLKHPSEIMVQLLAEAEAIYQKVAYNALHLTFVRKSIVTALIRGCPTLTRFSCCQCFLDKCVIQMFTTIRLHHSIKLLNRNISQTRKSRCRKLLKLSNL